MGEEQANASQLEGVALSDVLARLFARPVLLLFLFSVFALGVVIAGTGLHDPDTCWLLALGRYIVRHHALPDTDPFSFTFALMPGI